MPTAQVFMTLMTTDREVLTAVWRGAVYGFEVFLSTGLSLQETAPTLARLERQGLLSSMPEGPARRARYTLTALGRSVVEEQSRPEQASEGSR